MNPVSALNLGDGLRLEPGQATPGQLAPAMSARRPASVSLSMEIIRDGEGLQRLLPHWDALLEGNATRTPFMRRDWIELWWRHCAADHQPLIGAAWTQEGSLVAVVPFVIGPGAAPARRHLRHLAFLGGLGEVVAEGLDLLCLPSHEASLSTLLDKTLAAACGDWDTAHFGFLDLASHHFARLRNALERHASEVRLVNQQQSPLIRFNDGGWDAYLSQRSSSFRKKYRRLVAESEKAHRLTVREARQPQEAAGLLEILMNLHAERWTVGQSLFLQPRTRTFHEDLVARWCPHQKAVLLVIEFDGRPVAANYAFVENGRLWDYQGGWSLADIAHSPSKLILAENIRWAMRQGLREYDLLPGDVEYKKKWTKEHRLVADLEAVNPASLRARIFHSVRAVKRTLSQLLPGKS